MAEPTKILTRSEHYAEAVRLLDEANHLGHFDTERAAGILVAANIHATLASISDLVVLQESARFSRQLSAKEEGLR